MKNPIKQQENNVVLTHVSHAEKVDLFHSDVLRPTLVQWKVIIYVHVAGASIKRTRYGHTQRIEWTVDDVPKAQVIFIDPISGVSEDVLQFYLSCGSWTSKASKSSFKLMAFAVASSPSWGKSVWSTVLGANQDK